MEAAVLFEDAGRPEIPTLALLVRPPWAERIAVGQKTWEIRSRRTGVRGQIAIAQAGTGTLVGVCRPHDVLGPLDADAYRSSWRLWGGEGPEPVPPYPRTFAWVLRGARAFASPVPYRHPLGAVVWVRLGPEVRLSIGEALG